LLGRRLCFLIRISHHGLLAPLIRDRGLLDPYGLRNGSPFGGGRCHGKFVGRERRVLVFADESGFYLLPGGVRSYAPEARRPVRREKQTRDHLSVMGGMTPAGKVYTLARQESLNGLHSREFLVHLLRVAGPRLLVIWDGSPIHRRAEVGEFVSGMRGKVWLEA